FMTPKSDLCNVCETLRWKIGHINKLEDKEELLVEYASYIRIAKLEREYYNDNIKKAKENASHTINIYSSLASKERPTPNTVDAIAHFCYNWAQSVSVLYSPQQIGPLYFKNEGEFPVGVAKGANTTLSLVYDILIERNRGEKNIKITCDNCEGQNKNNATIAFYCWLVLITHYKKSVINTVDDIAEITRMSTYSNNAIRYKNHKWKYFDFVNYFTPYFKKVPNIRRYHHFLFKSTERDKVFCQETTNGEFTIIDLFKKNIIFDPYILSKTLDLQPILLTRQTYLYNEVRRFVNDPYKDITCSRPS
ncbi:362_t:CDS:2, partial [Acaulospora morrowiae]